MTPLPVRFWQGFKPWLIWLVFVAVGPLFGFLSFPLAAAAVELATGQSHPGWNLQISWHQAVELAHVLVFVYPFALFVGGLQAAFVGLIAARSYISVGKVSLLAVMLASAASFAVFASLKESRAKKPVSWQEIAAQALPHFTAGFGCWLLVARLRNNEPRHS